MVEDAEDFRRAAVRAERVVGLDQLVQRGS
jgi:hypothetical protein